MHLKLSEPHISSAERVYGDRTFENAITLARQSRSSDTIRNRSLTHASYVVKELFLLAREEAANVFISSDHLEHAYFCSREAGILPLARALLAQGASLQAVIAGRDARHSAASTFRDLLLRSSGAKLFVAEGEIAKKMNHFIVVEGLGYRFELDRGDSPAVVSFNQPEVAAALLAEFDFYKSHAHECSLQSETS